VGSANHDWNAAPPEFAGERIGMKSGWGRRRNPNQIRANVEPHRFDDLVRVRNQVRARRQGRNQRHRELGKLDQPAAS
jgi:hypothetical protein